MAKTLYFMNPTTAGASMHLGTNTNKQTGASWWYPTQLHEYRGNGSGTSQFTATPSVTGPMTTGLEAQYTTNEPVEWLSEPLSADFTISGTITANIWARQLTMTDNAAVNVVVYKLDGPTGVLTQIAKSARSTELVAGADGVQTVNNFTVVPTSTAFKKGDRIRVTVVFTDGGGTMATGGSMAMYWNGATAGASGDSWIQFTENLTFDNAETYRDVIWQTTNHIVGSAATSTRQALQFIALGNISELRLWLGKVGAPTDNLVVEIQTDSADAPSGTVVATLATIAGGTLTTTATITGNLGPVTLTANQKYWIVARRSGALDAANYFLVGQGYGWSNWDRFSTYNGTTWVQTTDQYYKLAIQMEFASTAVTDFYLTQDLITLPAPTPVTPALVSSFTGADESPLSEGGKWSQLNSAEAQLKRIGNQATVITDGVYHYSYYNVADYGPDVEAYFTVATASVSNNYMGIVLRVQQPGGTSQWDGYFVQCTGTGLVIYRVNNAASTTLLNVAIGGAAFASGDKFGAKVVGNVISGWIQRSGSSTWQCIGSVADVNNSFPNAGKVGLMMYNIANRIDNFYITTNGNLFTPGGVPTLLSDFTGADETTLSEGGKWLSVVSGGAMPQRLGNKAAGTATSGAAYWTPEMFGPDMEAYCTITGAGSSKFAGLITRIKEEGGASTWDGYAFYIGIGAGNTAAISSITNNVFTTLATNANVAWADGDKLGIRQIGGNHQLWRLPNGGSVWQLICSVYSALYPSGGRIAVYATGASTVTVDDIYVGNDTDMFVQRLSTTRGSSSVNVLASTVVGPIPGISLGEWYTPVLSPFTLGGRMKLNVWASESNTLANASIRADLDVVNGDGSFSAHWGVANQECLGPDAQSSGELFTSTGRRVVYLAGPDLAVADGQRLRLRVFADDAASGAMAATYTVTMSHGGPTQYASGDAYLSIPKAITLSGPGPKAITPASISNSQNVSGEIVELARIAPTTGITNTQNVSGAVTKPPVYKPIAPYNYIGTVLADSPRGYWRMGESASPLADSSGGGLSMFVVGSGMTYQQTGALANDSNGAVKSTATGRFEAAHSSRFDLGDVFTLEAWIKRNAAPDANWHSILSKQDFAYMFRINNVNQLMLVRSITADICVSTTTITDQNWHHVVATKNGGTVKLYIDGVDRTGTVTDSAMTNNTLPLLIGVDAGGAYPANLTIDEVAIYPTALSASRVLAHYQVGVGIVGGGGTTNTQTVSGAIGIAKRATPTTTIANNQTVSGSVRKLARITPAGITNNQAVSGSVRKLFRVLPTTVSNTNSVAGDTVARRAVKPTTTVTFNNQVSGSIQKIVPPKIITPTTGITNTNTVSGKAGAARPITPAGITNTNNVTGIFTKRVPVIPTGITFTNTVSGDIQKFVPARPIVPTGITNTQSVTGATRTLRRVAPTTTITNTQTVVGNIGRLRPIPATAITFTNTASGAIRKLARVGGAATFTATVSGAIVVRRTIGTGAATNTNTVSGLVTKPSTARPITPTTTVTNTNSVSGAVRVLKRIAPTTTVTNTQNVTGAIVVRRGVLPTGITNTNSVSGAIRVGRGVLPTGITFTNSVSGAVRKLATIKPTTTVTFTNSVAGAMTVLPIKIVVPATVNNSQAVSGSNSVVRRVTVTAATVTNTQSAAGAIGRRRPVAPGGITNTNTTSGSIRALKRVAPTGITFTNTVSGAVRKLARIAPTTTVTNTQSVSGFVTTQPIKVISPQGITNTQTVTGSIRVARGIRPTTTVTFTNSASGSVARLAAVRAAAAANTQTVTGIVLKLVAVKPGAATNTQTVTGAIKMGRGAVPSTITYTGTVTGNIKLPGKVTPTTGITYTTSVTGSIRRLVRVPTTTITYTNTVTGGIVRRFPVKPASTVTYTNNIFGGVKKTVRIRPTSNITWTNNVTGSIVSVRILISASKLYPGKIVSSHRGRTTRVIGSNTEALQLPLGKARIVVGDRGDIELGDKE